MPTGWKESTWREFYPKVHTFTKVEKWGISEGNPGLREWGYGQYINAYVQDHDFYLPSAGQDGVMGVYATERVAFDADQATISKARKLARDRARQRYLREKESD